MRCLHCGREIPQSFFEAAKADRFSCPHCAAEHVRREIGRLPSGEPQYSVRLWGHPTGLRKKKPGNLGAT